MGVALERLWLNPRRVANVFSACNACFLRCCTKTTMPLMRVIAQRINSPMRSVVPVLGVPETGALLSGSDSGAGVSGSGSLGSSGSSKVETGESGSMTCSTWSES